MTAGETPVAPLYGLPDWAPFVAVSRPAFGTVELMTGHKEKRGKGVPMPPTSYLVLPERTIGLPLKPVRFRALLEEHLQTLGLAGEMVADAMSGSTIVRWTPPDSLLTEARLLLDPSETVSVPARVAEAFIAMATAMAAEIDLTPIRDAVIDVLALPANGPVMREVSYEVETRLEEAIREALPVAAGVMASAVSSRLSLGDIAQLADVYVVAGLLDATPKEPAITTYHYNPDDAAPPYRGFQRGERKHCLVRPAFVSLDAFVQTLGIQAGLAVVPRNEIDTDEAGSLPQLYLQADAIHPLPALRALVAPGFRLVRASETMPVMFQTIATIPMGAFDPREPVTMCKTASWVPSLRSSLKEARSTVIDATGGEPLGIFSCVLDDVPGVVGSSDAVLQYATNLGADDCILPWWLSQAAVQQKYNKNTYDVNLDEYRRELAAELLREMRPGLQRPVAAVSTRFHRLADVIDALARPALAEALALQCPQPVVAVIQNPLEALLAALRGATEARLLGEQRAGEVALAALLAVTPPSGVTTDADGV